MPDRSLKDGILEHLRLVVSEILRNTKSKTISIKLRTLLKYAYVSYAAKTTNLNMIRGLVPRIRPPPQLTNQYFYRDIEDFLRRNFNVRFERRRNARYVVLYNTGGAPTRASSPLTSPFFERCYPYPGSRGT